MTEKILRQFQIAGPIVNQTGSRMAETMKTRRPLWPRDVEAIENRVKHILAKDILIQGVPIGFAKKQNHPVDCRELLL